MKDLPRPHTLVIAESYSCWQTSLNSFEVRTLLLPWARTEHWLVCWGSCCTGSVLLWCEHCLFCIFKNQKWTSKPDQLGVLPGVDGPVNRVLKQFRILPAFSSPGRSQRHSGITQAGGAWCQSSNNRSNHKCTGNANYRPGTMIGSLHVLSLNS